MNNIPTKPELERLSTSLHAHGHVDGEAHSHLHVDTAPPVQPKTLFVGTSTDEQVRFKVSDKYGVKITNWIPRHRTSIAIRHLKSMGLFVHEIYHQDVICDLYLTPSNKIERDVIEVIEL